MRWEKRTVDSGGVRLVTRDSGGEGRTVVLVHGLGFGQRSWDRVAPRLSAGGLRVVTYDQRGHGASDVSEEYSPSAFAEDLAAVLGELRLEEPILVGHSLGAMIALEHAASRDSCMGVVCVDGGLPVALPSTDWEEVEAQMRRPLPRLMTWAMKVARLGTKLTSEELKGVVEEHDAKIPDLGGAYDRISCPILMVLGSRADPVPQGEEIREAVSDGARSLRETHQKVEVKWLPCGHNVPLERPKELADLIIRFAR
ncbi:MAG: alpha/beta hydrolase [Actinomycetota bacterium]|nr:alpha/beta hydrolase [Actinomycetota bacterium]